MLVCILIFAFLPIKTIINIFFWYWIFLFEKLMHRRPFNKTIIIKLIILLEKFLMLRFREKIQGQYYFSFFSSHNLNDSEQKVLKCVWIKIQSCLTRKVSNAHPWFNDMLISSQWIFRKRILLILW